MVSKFFRPMPIMVRCPDCKHEYDEDYVDFINIEEDMEGRDILTFHCPLCDKPVKSLRRG